MAFFFVFNTNFNDVSAQRQLGHELTVPTPVIVEAWRDGRRSARIAAPLDACIVEPLLPQLARVAGEAIVGWRTRAEEQ